MKRVFLSAGLAAVVLMAGGCTALFLGGAAAGGYAVGKDERSVGRIVDDATITASVKSKLLADKHVAGLRIDVDTREGVVTLNGNVTSYVSKSQAESLAQKVEGVVRVDNNLKVVAPKSST